MADLLHRRASLLAALVLAGAAGWAPAGAARAEGPGAFLDAVVADVEGRIIAASDIALARALALFDLGPSAAPIQAAEVEGVVAARLLEAEAARLGIGGSAEGAEAAWRAAGARAGGMDTLIAWLRRNGIEENWARSAVEADLRRRRYIDLRFRAFAFVPEAEVERALGPGSHGPEARERARGALQHAIVRRRLAAWLKEARARARVRLLLEETQTIPAPFPMPAAPARGADAGGLSP